MRKKILYGILIGLAFLLISTICFASENEVKSTDLGNEITSSIEENKIDNFVSQNASATKTSNIKDDAKNTGNAIKDGTEKARKFN